MDRDTTKKYSNEKVTVFWKPRKCMHSTKCFTSLIAVFDPSKHPWIDMNGATTDEIVTVVKNCPSGALSFKMNANFKEPT